MPPRALHSEFPIKFICRAHHSGRFQDGGIAAAAVGDDGEGEHQGEGDAPEHLLRIPESLTERRR